MFWPHGRAPTNVPRVGGEMERTRIEFTRTRGLLSAASPAASPFPKPPFDGAFLAAAALGIPGDGPILDSVDVGTVWIQGDTLVVGAPEKMRFESEGHLGTFETELEFFENEKGRLARIAAIFPASTLDEAEPVAYEVFSRAVSTISFLTDTPIEIKLWMVTDMSTMESWINAILEAGRVSWRLNRFQNGQAL